MKFQTGDRVAARVCGRFTKTLDDPVCGFFHVAHVRQRRIYVNGVASGRVGKIVCHSGSAWARRAHDFAHAVHAWRRTPCPPYFSPGAAAWMASAWTPPESSPASAVLIMRWRSSRLFPRKASDTI